METSWKRLLLSLQLQVQLYLVFCLQLDKSQDKLHICVYLFKEKEQRFQNQLLKIEMFF